MQAAITSPPEMTRVLIVDDEVESRTRLRALLQAHGHAVVEASNGLDALERARQQPPDLVISDVLMPQMDGFALCRAYRTDPDLARAPFMFYTGTYASPSDMALAGRLGAARFLVKSMAAEEVIRAITEALGQSQGATMAGVADVVTDATETESWRLYDESLIRTLEHRHLELVERGPGAAHAHGQPRAVARAGQRHRHARPHRVRQRQVRRGDGIPARAGPRPDACRPPHPAQRCQPRVRDSRRGACRP